MPGSLVGGTVVSLVLAWAASPASAGEYRNADFGLRLDPPPGWSCVQVSSGDERLELVLTPVTAADRVQLKLRVDPPSLGSDPSAAVTIALDSVAADANHFDGRRTRRRIAGRDAPALVIDNRSLGSTWRVRQAYLSENGFLYQLQDATLADEYDTRVAGFDAIWDTLGFIPLSEAQAARRRLVELAGYCGSEVDWAADWTDAARRARREARPILVTLRRYPGFTLTDERMSGFFMDEDVLALLDERFVSLRADALEELPFADPSRYGLGDYTFGSAMLVVTPGGEVLLDSVVHLEDLLRAALTLDPALPGPPARLAGDALEQARDRLRRGELDLADSLLQHVLDPRAETQAHARVEALRLSASIATRRREGATALSELARARAVVQAWDDEEIRESLEFDLVLDALPALVGLGRADQAVSSLDDQLARGLQHARLDEACFRRGELALALGEQDVARAWFERLALDPERAGVRWAWQAAATLTSTAFRMGSPSDGRWPTQEMLAQLTPPHYEPLAPDDVERALGDAVAYLLATQREDGSWPHHGEIGRRPEEPADDFQLAIGALCVQGLLSRREEHPVDDAVTRAAAWVLDAYERRADAVRPASFMDYAVWSRAYVLWMVADLLDVGGIDPQRAQHVAQRVYAELAALEKPGGGWSYYVTGDLAAAPAATRVSMSFTTAVDVLALLRARESGLHPPEVLVERGLDALESARDGQGRFAYLAGTGSAITGPSGAAGRGPLCALALERGGRGSEGAIENALDAFVEHREAYARETGKALMHAGLQAEGSHWLLFDYAMSAKALATLPARRGSRFVRPLRELVLRARTSEGSFVDNPLLGPVFGAGMALAALEHLRGETSIR